MGKFDKRAYAKRYYRKNRKTIRKRQRAHFRKNKKEIQARYRAWYRAVGTKIKRAYQWSSNYGLSLADGLALFSFQAGCCAICGEKKSLEGRWKSLNVDHEHFGKKRVRGFLCTLCNRVLGALERRPTVLRQCKPFWNYLVNPPARRLKIRGWKNGRTKG